MTRYLLSLGSNCPDGRERLESALQWLRGQFAEVEASEIYSSRALNGIAPDYFNMVARISSPMTVTALNAAAKAYEAACGRTPESKTRGIIEMDVDIVAAGPTIIRPDEYTRPYFTRGLNLLPTPAK